MKIDVDKDTFGILIKGLYEQYNGTTLNIPDEVYGSICEMLDYFIDNNLWDFNKVSVNDWVKSDLRIVLKSDIPIDEYDRLCKSSLFWEVPYNNDDDVLFVSVGITRINVPIPVEDMDYDALKIEVEELQEYCNYLENICDERGISFVKR